MFFVGQSFSKSMEHFLVLVYLLYRILGEMFVPKKLWSIKKKSIHPCLYHIMDDKSALYHSAPQLVKRHSVLFKRLVQLWELITEQKIRSKSYRWSWSSRRGCKE